MGAGARLVGVSAPEGVSLRFVCLSCLFICALKTIKEMACSGVSWQELVDGVRGAFSTDKVDVDRLTTLLNSYQSQRSDWEQYALFDHHT